MKDLKNPEFKRTGYIQVYTGEGKGKTTAAMGLACRALGHGMKVLIMQFCKDKQNTGEYEFLHLNPNLNYFSCGLPHYPTRANLTIKDKKSFDKGWQTVKDRVDFYDLIILDELNIAIDFEFITVAEVIEFLNIKPENVEIVITGRNAHPKINEVAHLVTNMTCIKHYYDIGVKSRKGMEY